jgi:hypothetical protein
MPDVQEVFRMATQKVQPDPGALDRQHRDQRRRVAKQKIAVYALVVAIAVAGIVIGINVLPSDDSQPAATGSTPTPVPTPTAIPSPTLTTLPSAGALEAGTYVVSAVDPDFDAAHRITITVPEGYQALLGWGILKDAGRQWISASVVGSVYADACHWAGTLLDPPVGANFDALVAALANQLGTRASTPTDVTLAGFAGKRMELTVPARINVAECYGGQFRFWTYGLGESDYRNTPFTGEHGRLWILDVDGVPLVMEAAWPIGASAQVQAELTQMVESIRIDPL